MWILRVISVSATPCPTQHDAVSLEGEGAHGITALRKLELGGVGHGLLGGLRGFYLLKKSLVRCTGLGFLLVYICPKPIPHMISTG